MAPDSYRGLGWYHILGSVGNKVIPIFIEQRLPKAGKHLYPSWWILFFFWCLPAVKWGDVTWPWGTSTLWVVSSCKRSSWIYLIAHLLLVIKCSDQKEFLLHGRLILIGWTYLLSPPRVAGHEVRSIYYMAKPILNMLNVFYWWLSSKA